MPNSLRPHGLQPTRVLCPWDFPGKDTGVGCHFLLQGIFPTQGLNLGLSHCRQILYQLSYKGSRLIIFFTQITYKKQTEKNTFNLTVQYLEKCRRIVQQLAYGAGTHVYIFESSQLEGLYVGDLLYSALIHSPNTLPLFPYTRANAKLSSSASGSKTPARGGLLNNRSLPTQYFIAKVQYSSWHTVEN